MLANKASHDALMPCLCSDTAVIPLHKRTIIGRTRSCDVVLEDFSIFDRHAVITLAEDGISAILSPQRNDQGEIGICYLNESLLELPGRVAHCDRIKFGHTEQTFVFDIKRQASRRGNQSHTLVSVRERIRELLMQASSDTAIDEVADKRLHELHERFDEGESCPQISPARAAVMHPPSSLCSSASSHEDVVRYPLPPEQRERVQNEKNRLLQRLRDANHVSDFVCGG